MRGEAEFFISLEAERDLDDVRILATVHELGLFYSSQRFDIDDYEMRIFSFDIPSYANPGLYEVRFTISNDEVREIVYRDIVVE